MHYLGFGVLIVVLSLFFRKKHNPKKSNPSVSFIIAAYNEEKIIKAKIINDLSLDYPKDKIEIIIVSDGSTDKTNIIAKEYEKNGIISIHQAKRMGKTAAINRAVSQAKNEILIFSDANSMFKKNAIKKLVRHFNNLEIGGVCGRKSIIKNKKRKASLGDNLFWHYESALKQAESNLGSIPTADGEIFACRRACFRYLNPELINDDMAITLDIISQKKRVIYDQEAITEEEASLTFKDDFNVKSRMIYGGIQIISKYKEMLNPLKSTFALQFFFHKVLRYFMWSLLVALFISNAFILEENPFFKILLLIQIAFYLMASMGYFLEKNKLNQNIFYLPYYYCNVNLAALKGFCYFIQQQPIVEIWKKAKR